MISIPLSIIFIIYLVLLILILGLFFIVMHHLTSTGTFTLVSFVVTFIVSALLIYILYGTWVVAIEIDWNGVFVLFDGIGSSGPGSGGGGGSINSLF